MGPLQGIRVLDMGHAGVGPYAGSVMAQLGADVIKCEPPWGDIIHQAGAGSGNGIGPDQMAPLYIALNLNKRGIVLNIKEPADLAIFNELVKTADVYMDNWRDGAADRNGIGYDALAKVNPRIVYVNSSGFGARGPLREMGSYDMYGELFSGITSFTGAAGAPGEKAQGGVRVDTTTSLCLVDMILAALWHREKTGKGQKIQGSQMESAMQHSAIRAIDLNFGITPAPMGSAHPHVVPSQAFATKDGYVAVTAQTDEEWLGFCAVLGQPELILHPLFHDNPQRVQHRAKLLARIEPLFLSKTSAEWTETFQARRVPAGQLYRRADQLQDPHIMGTGMLCKVDTHWGEMFGPALPARFSATPTGVRPGPRPGQDTAEVLAEVGYGPEYVREWVGPAQRMAEQGGVRGGSS